MITGGTEEAAVDLLLEPLTDEERAHLAVRVGLDDKNGSMNWYQILQQIS